MSRILILFAHPALEKSRVHRRLVREAHAVPGVTFNDLYEAYPTFDIDVRREQALLVEHDLIVLQHPFYWYSTPALIKQWEDLVLEHGWAYGSQGHALAGKRLLSIISAGGRAEAYQHAGFNRFTIREFLAPIEQTAHLCGMAYLPPLIFHGAHRMNEADIDQVAGHYRHVLEALRDDALDLVALSARQTLNDALNILPMNGDVATEAMR
jgi:glutathione-regulated potassium-efflux system ancillary protein KefG